MSMYICTRCRNLCDSDDGCEAIGPVELACVPCFDQLSDDEMRAALRSQHGRAFTAEQQRIIDAHMAEDDGDGP